MIIKASLKGMRIAEAPVTLSRDLRDRAPHLRPWRDGWRHLRFMLSLSPRWTLFVPGLALLAIGLFGMLLTAFRTTFIGGVMQHIEEAGIHSGDSACSLPPYSLAPDIVAEIARQAEVLAKALSVRGLMNVQFAVKDGEVYIIEVNPRASRTVPFVAKAIGSPIAKLAARVMAGEMLADLPRIDLDIPHIAVKEAVFPFARFPGVDPVLSPEMKSTGEVMGLDRDFSRAFAKAQLGAGTILPHSGSVFVSVKDSDKPVILPAVLQLLHLGFTIVATDGTARYLAGEGVAVERVNKVAQGRPHIVDRVVDGDIALIFNTTEGWQSLKDSESIRRAGLMNKVPQFTTASASVAAVQAIAALRDSDLEVRPLQSYHLRLAS
jgi:carbamoyl-phosphate synthase large subunit